MNSHGFERLEQRHLASLNIEYSLYQHVQTAARHIHFDSDDDNNAFMVALPTRPEDSTGVAHILEHTTLCGSKRYPVRDPFFMMLRRSLNTFMNAFTSGDCTAYPFATQNRKDFDNLLNVYLDAVFFPLLDELDFAQEGWRLDFDDPPGDAGKLMYKGVVYNEMKGAMSAPSSQLWMHLGQGLLPDTIYRYNSGGDPQEIPELEYQALRGFHAKYYHPSHAVFMTYGSFDVADHQRAINERVLAAFEKQNSLPPLERQTTFASPRALEATYAVEADADPGRKTHALWGWVLGETGEPGALLEAHVLSAVLLDNSGSPLRQFLETTDLADAPSELCGIDDSACQIIFAAGVEGTDPEHVDEIKLAMEQVIDSVANNGIAHATLEGIVDRIEMSQRDVGGDGFPYGLQIMTRALPGVIYGRDPGALLDLDGAISELRERIADPLYVRDLLKRCLINNPHRSQVVMRPDPHKAENEQAQERARLETIRAAFDDARVTALHAEIKALEARQEAPQDPDILPTVTLADVPTTVKRVERRVIEMPDVEIHEYVQPTNGIAHVHLVYELGELSERQAELLPFFTEFFLELGNGAADYATVQQRRALSGVFNAYATARTAVDDASITMGRMVLSSKGLVRRLPQFIDELTEALSGLRIDETERLDDLIVQTRADAEASITDRGHALAAIGAARDLNVSTRLDDLWQGPANILACQDLDKRRNDSGTLEQLVETFAGLKDKLLGARCTALTVGEADTAVQSRELVANRVIASARHPSPKYFAEFEPGSSKSTAWVTNTQVNFCAKAYAVVPPEHAHAAPLLVLGKYLQDGFLHPAIREQGGAYGSGAAYDLDSASFRFFSYRDPRLAETLADFDQSVDWLAQNEDNDRLQESILGVIRNLDKARTPAGAAISAFYNELDGTGFDFQQRLREHVLNVDYGDLLTVVDNYFAAGGIIGVITNSGEQQQLEQLELETVKL